MLQIDTVHDFQIFQQSAGYADVPVAGSAVFAEKAVPNVLLLVFREDDSTLVRPPQLTPIRPDGTFSTVLRLPTGGHYTLCATMCGEIPDGDYVSGADWVDGGRSAIPSTAVYHIGVGEVFLVAGQSNASGVGKTPGFDPPHPLVHLCRNSLRWTTAAHPTNDSTATAHPENADFYLPGTSPYLRFGTTLCRALGCPIGLVAVSKGDTYLGQWLPESDGTQADFPLPDGYSAGSLWRVVETALDAVGGRIAGVAWYQGENDADVDGMCAAYGERFARFVGYVRARCASPSLPFYTVQIGKATDGRTTDAHCGILREQQRQAAHKIPHVYVIPAHDQPLSDPVHNNTAANGVIGERMAWSALSGEYGRPYFGKAPDALHATRDTDGKIRVTFADVVMGLVDFGCTAPLVRLRTEGEYGEIPVAAARCHGHTLSITPDGETYGGRLLVDIAADALPRVPVCPIDRATGMPLLGVYGLPVE